MEWTDPIMLLIVLFFAGGVPSLLWNIAGNIHGCVEVLCDIRRDLGEEIDERRAARGEYPRRYSDDTGT